MKHLTIGQVNGIGEAVTEFVCRNISRKAVVKWEYDEKSLKFKIF